MSPDLPNLDFQITNSIFNFRKCFSNTSEISSDFTETLNCISNFLMDTVFDF